MLYLNRIEKATDEDKAWKIDEWVKLFKAKTWEDVRMVAQENETMISAVETMYEKQSDEMAREIMRRKQDEINHQRRMKKEREELLRSNAELKGENTNLKDKNDELKAEIARLQAEIDRLKG